ncbi:MAG: alpha/beta fold hydrolase [Bacteroidota bacterium]
MRNIILFILLLLFASCSVSFKHLQKQQNSYQLTTVDQLQDPSYTRQIEVFYDDGEEGEFAGRAGINIYYKLFVNPDEKAAVMISAGRTEAAIKYKELIHDLYKNGYSVYIHDHRGQGQSGRMTANPEMGYIDSFQYYIDDMKYFYDNILTKNDHKKKFLLAHSMGGAIGMTYLQQYPADFNAAAFSSPMLGLPKPGCGVVKMFVGDEPKYAPGQSGYHDDKVKFKKNKLTTSEVRYNRMNAAFAKVPEARLGGATSKWVNCSCLQFKYMNENIGKIKTPFILFSAAKEQIVDPKAHEHFVNHAQELNVNCKAFLVEDAKHELLIEQDEQRIATINEILHFYNNY